MSFSPTTRLDGKVAVVAGGLGAIGHGSARRLAALGATCVLLHRKGDASARLAELPAEAGQSHGALRADIVDSDSLNAAARSVQATHGRCDILVNSAGHTHAVPAGDLEGLTDELIDDLLRANFRGVFATIRAFAPLLKANGDGLIVNVSSISGFTGVGSNLAYVAAKAGLDVVGDALAKVLAPAVRVVSVSPGAVDSEFVSGRGDEFRKKVATTTPLGRIGLPDDVAATIEALATTLRFVTGTRIVVDGGRHL
jgi:3-oxoacyl-[acyl-carrier protein] reductase